MSRTNIVKLLRKHSQSNNAEIIEAKNILDKQLYKLLAGIDFKVSLNTHKNYRWLCLIRSCLATIFGHFHSIFQEYSGYFLKCYYSIFLKVAKNFAKFVTDTHLPKAEIVKYLCLLMHVHGIKTFNVRKVSISFAIHN